MTKALTIDAVLAATWPAAETVVLGPITLRRSPGGGQRVQAATLAGNDLPDEDLLRHAEQIMADWGQPALFRIDPRQSRFDAALGQAGYIVNDKTELRIGPLFDPLSEDDGCFSIWPPLAVIEDLWAENGNGSDRLAVMQRATGAHSAILARHDDRPAGIAFVAAAGDTAVVHALAVAPGLRRQGIARRIMSRASAWAEGQGLRQMAALVTEDNDPARHLYDTLGMKRSGGYHYRKLP